MSRVPSSWYVHAQDRVNPEPQPTRPEPVSLPTCGAPVDRSIHPSLRSSQRAVVPSARRSVAFSESGFLAARGRCAGYVYAQDGVKIREPVVQLPYSRCTS